MISETWDPSEKSLQHRDLKESHQELTNGDRICISVVTNKVYRTYKHHRMHQQPKKMFLKQEV